MRYGDWVDTQGVVDDVTVTTYRAPASYTGQDMFEVICHGNPLLVEAIWQSLLARGARRAKPGEFTQRAVLNGKMDLLEAEAVHGLIEAHTRFQADRIRAQAHGPLVSLIGGLVDQILGVQAHIEASIDYGEEDIDALDRENILERIDRMLLELENLRQTGGFAEGMQRGFKVLLTGAPNVGKSTLFNKLVKRERAIVTAIPGTTRDLIHEDVEIAGLPVVLIDSAGVRETTDTIETLGIDKIFALLEEVDLVLFLRTAGSKTEPYERVLALPDHKWMAIWTKADLSETPEGDEIVISAETGLGLDRLEREVVIRLSSAIEGQQAYLISRRQKELISEALETLASARKAFASGLGEEILSSYLNDVRNRLGELTGETTVEDVLDRMFSDFCLGK